MHLSMLSPTPPITGMGGALLPRDLMQNFAPRVLNLVPCIFIGNNNSYKVKSPILLTSACMRG